MGLAGYMCAGRGAALSRVSGDAVVVQKEGVRVLGHLFGGVWDGGSADDRAWRGYFGSRARVSGRRLGGAAARVPAA